MRYTPATIKLPPLSNAREHTVTRGDQVLGERRGTFSYLRKIKENSGAHNPPTKRMKKGRNQIVASIGELVGFTSSNRYPKK